MNTIIVIFIITTISQISFIIPSLAKFSQTTTTTTISNFETCLEKFGFEGGNLIRRSSTNQEYQKLNGEQWNTYKGKIYPVGCLLPNNSRDVQISIICARQQQLRLVPKCGGHGFTKYAYGDSDSIVIDLQRLKTIQVDEVNRVVQVGGGTRSGELLHGLWNQGRYLTPTGMCPEVGISGCTMGGGYGYLVRTYGLSTDNILEIEFVDVSGNLLTLNHKSYSDLFWALRGGGSGSFGIVTSFKLKIHDAPTLVYARLHYNNFSSFPKLFSSWNSFFNTNPPSFNSQIQAGNHTIDLDFIDVQDDTSSMSIKSRINRLQMILKRFPKPNIMSIQLYDYSEFVVQIGLDTSSIFPNPTTLSQLASIRLPENFGSLHINSFFIDKNLNESESSGFYSLLTKIVNISEIQLRFYALGEAPNHLHPTVYTAFVHRRPHLKSLCTVFGISPNQNWKGFKKMRSFFKESMFMLHHKESYQNYIDESMENYLDRYYGVNLKRLIHIKNKYDPDNYFHNPQSIPLQH